MNHQKNISALAGSSSFRAVVQAFVQADQLDLPLFPSRSDQMIELPVTAATFGLDDDIQQAAPPHSRLTPAAAGRSYSRNSLSVVGADVGRPPLRRSTLWPPIDFGRTSPRIYWNFIDDKELKIFA